MDKGMNFFYLLGGPLGYVMEWVYNLVPNYGWDIIIFTLLVRIISLPLAIYQQKSTAKMSAFQPMVMEIQKKYKNDQEKQSVELQKLQNDFGYNPMSGCWPMFLNMFVIFGVIEVVYRPLQRMFHMSTETLDAAGAILTGMGQEITTVTRDGAIINAVAGGVQEVIACFTAEEAALIAEFAGHQNFFGVNLMAMPELSLAVETLPLLLWPVLSLVTMFVSQHIAMKSTGQDAQMQGSMKIMMYMMPLMFVWFSFTVPVGFLLYYTISNVVMTVQSAVLRKFYDPKKMTEQIKAEIEAKKKAQKKGVKSTTVKMVDKKTGNVVEKNLSAAEMNKLRLEYARKLDEEKYANERTTPLNGETVAETEEE